MDETSSICFLPVTAETEKKTRERENSDLKTFAIVAVGCYKHLVCRYFGNSSSHDDDRWWSESIFNVYSDILIDVISWAFCPSSLQLDEISILAGSRCACAAHKLCKWFHVAQSVCGVNGTCCNMIYLCLRIASAFRLVALLHVSLSAHFLQHITEFCVFT